MGFGLLEHKGKVKVKVRVRVMVGVRVNVMVKRWWDIGYEAYHASLRCLVRIGFASFALPERQKLPPTSLDEISLFWIE